MSRLSDVKREDLDEAGKATWDRIAAARLSVSGPYSVVIRVPALAERVVALEDFFRFEGTLTDAERELVTLATVRESEARFGWAVHVRGAQRSGTRPEAIGVVRTLATLGELTQRERVLVELTRSLCRTRSIPQDVFERARAELGEETLVQAVTLVGHYSMIGLLLNGFEVAPPAGGASFD